MEWGRLEKESVAVYKGLRTDEIESVLDFNGVYITIIKIDTYILNLPC